jgi:tetratricopeptide (TPR) repeat protein
MTTKRRFRGPGRLLPFCLVLLSVLAPANPAASAPDDLATKFRINDQNPAANLPSAEDANENPLEFGYMIQDLIARGEGAIEKKEWDRAVKYYEALALAVPDRAITFRKLCSGYAELGKIDIAAANCGKALTLDGARVIDHFKFVNLSLRKEKLTASELSDMEASIAHVRAHIAAHPAAPPKPEPAPKPSNEGAKQKKSLEQIKEEFLKRQQAGALADLERRGREQEAQKPVNLALEIEVLACKLAVRLRDQRKLATCVDALKRLKADEKLVLPFEWANAIVRKDSARANALLQKAKGVGLPPVALQAMTDEQRRTFADAGVLGFFKRRALGVVLAILAAALATWGALRFARSRKLGTTPEAQPQ